MAKLKLTIAAREQFRQLQFKGAQHAARFFCPWRAFENCNNEETARGTSYPRMRESRFVPASLARIPVGVYPERAEERA